MDTYEIQAPIELCLLGDLKLPMNDGNSRHSHELKNMLRNESYEILYQQEDRCYWNNLKWKIPIDWIMSSTGPHLQYLDPSQDIKQTCINQI